MIKTLKSQDAGMKLQQNDQEIQILLKTHTFLPQPGPTKSSCLVTLNYDL